MVSSPSDTRNRTDTESRERMTAETTRTTGTTGITGIQEPFVVYFSSISENTKRFVDKLPFDSLRVSMKGKEAGAQRANRPYVLVTPSYGAGHKGNAVPKQLLKFLSVFENRMNCIGVVGGGNRNFAEYYQYGAKFLAGKLEVPMLYGFEISGTPADVSRVTDGINDKWSELLSMSGLNDGDTVDPDTNSDSESDSESDSDSNSEGDTTRQSPNSDRKGTDDSLTDDSFTDDSLP